MNLPRRSGPPVPPRPVKHTLLQPVLQKYILGNIPINLYGLDNLNNSNEANVLILLHGRMGRKERMEPFARKLVGRNY